MHADLRQDHRLVVLQAEPLRQPDGRRQSAPGELTVRPFLHRGSMSNPRDGNGLAYPGGTILTRGHRPRTRCRASRAAETSGVTRTGFTRHTPPSRSSRPSGAQTSMSVPVPDSRTATQVAVSGQVATASCTLPNASTGGPPK